MNWENWQTPMALFIVAAVAGSFLWRLIVIQKKKSCGGSDCSCSFTKKNKQLRK